MNSLELIFTQLFLTVILYTVKSEWDGRIVGGEEAAIEDHPYQVNLIVNNSWFCGGFIISDRYIMTAAHCVQDTDPETVVVKAGSSFRKNGTVIFIEEVKFHPSYNDPAFDNDIAVMKTKEQIEFSDVISPVSLPKKHFRVPLSDEIVVSGWGLTKQGGSRLPDRLMDVKLDLVSWPRCKLAYPTILTRHMLCAGPFFFGGKSTCQGDSGGAAVYDGKAVGIVSFGRGCGQPLSPSVFADIASLRDWVEQETGL